MGITVTVFNYTTKEKSDYGSLRYFIDEQVYESFPWWKTTDSIYAEHDEGKFSITDVEIEWKSIDLNGIHYKEVPKYKDLRNSEYKETVNYVYNRRHKQCVQVGKIIHLVETINVFDWSIKDCFLVGVRSVCEITKDYQKGGDIARPVELDSYERIEW